MSKPKNLPASVRQRLLSKARKLDRPFNDLLIHYAMERFLYRLGQSDHRNDFVLKGALLLRVWEAVETRPTRDIDLLGLANNDVAQVEAVVRELCGMEVEPDGIVFDADSLRGEAITEGAGYHGVRVTFRGYLGTAHVKMQVDVGFGDAVTPEPEWMEYPTRLGFPAPRIRCYSMENSIAEKLQAMVALGEINSRMRDFYDVWWLSETFAFEGPVLAGAIAATFARRHTKFPRDSVALQAQFVRNPEKAAQWRAFIENVRTTESPQNFVVAVRALREFLQPVLAALDTGVEFGLHWPPGGPWKDVSVAT